ncbi:MAG: transglutaminase-like domain-containing protein [Patescibacteria group bacterium]
MEFLSEIKNWYFKIAQNQGWLFYYKKQIYQVEYKVKIQNISALQQSGWIVIPVPDQKFSQKIKAAAVFEPEPDVLDADNMYFNKFAAWRFDLEPQSIGGCSMKLTIEVSPSKGVKPYDCIINDLKYKKADLHVNADLQEIKEAAEKIKEQSKDRHLAKFINDYALSNLEYGNPIKGLYSAEDAIRLDKVDCGGFNSFAAAIARACGLSAKLIFGFWAGYKKSEMHAWLEIENDGKLVPADPSMEYLRKRGQTRKSGEFGFVGSDRIIFSEGSDYEIELDGEKHQIEILQHPVILPEDKSLKIKVETAVEAKKL